MDWGEWEFTLEAAGRLEELFPSPASKFPPQSTNTFLELLNFNAANAVMEVDESKVDAREDDLAFLLKESLDSGDTLPESTFLGVSNNSLARILSSVRSCLDERRFSNFCELMASWSDDDLIELSLKSVVLSKLKEGRESSACMIFSIKELALHKPDKFCHIVLHPLLTDNEFQFSDAELLSEVFPILGSAQKDFLIMSMTKQKDFQETDWLLLHPLVKDLPQRSLISLAECIQKFSSKFRTSQVFGRFLVNFCKNLEFVGNKDALMATVEQHQTLMRVQALRYLKSA